MSSLVISFVALVIFIGSNIVESSTPAAPTIDLTNFIKLVNSFQHAQPQNPNKQNILRLRIDSSGSDYSTESDSDDDSDSDDVSREDDNNRIARERSKDRIVDLLEKVINEKNAIDHIKHRKTKKINPGRYDDADNTRLAKERIIDLIETAAANERKKNHHITNRKSKLNHGRNGHFLRGENIDNIPSRNDNVAKQLLEKLLSQTANVEVRQPKPKKRLIPNRLTPTINMDDVKKYYGIKDKKEEVTGLEDYSKVYIVLNPQAVKNSKNKGSLNDLISNVLSLSSQTPKREVEPFHYKGFVVNDSLAKRRFKDIKTNISLEDDEKKLRVDPLEVPLERITAMPS